MDIVYGFLAGIVMGLILSNVGIFRSIADWFGQVGTWIKSW